MIHNLVLIKVLDSGIRKKIKTREASPEHRQSNSMSSWHKFRIEILF